jgi:hypothetical protein
LSNDCSKCGDTSAGARTTNQPGRRRRSADPETKTLSGSSSGNEPFDTSKEIQMGRSTTVHVAHYFIDES